MGAGAAERRGRAGRRDRAGQPLRQPDHGRPRRGPAAAGPLAPARAATRRTSTPPPARASRRPTCRWDGQTMVYECGDLLAESERFPDGPRRAVADVDLDRIRQERLRQGTFDDNRRTLRTTGSRRSAPSSSSSARRRGDIGLRRKVDRFPFVPDDAERLALDCYEAYNIQVSGLEQRLHAIGQPEGRHRRQRRPRLDARADRRGQGDGPARPAAQRHPRASRCPASRRARRTKVVRHPARASRSA